MPISTILASLRAGIAQAYDAATVRLMVIVSALMASLLVAPAAFGQSTITFDVTPFFDSLNQWLPTFVGIFAIIGGIIAALGFSRYIIGTIVDALSGKGGI